MYCSRRCERQLVRCIGRVLVGVEGSLGYGYVFSWGVFRMSVGIAIYFIGTGVFFTGAVSENLNLM